MPSIPVAKFADRDFSIADAPVRDVELENVWLGSCRKAFECVENAEGIQKRNVRLGE